MALHDNPPHRVNTYTVASSADQGGGTALSYTLADSSLKCSINTASSSEREMFSQSQQIVTHTVAFLTSAITTPLVRGMKLVATDNSISLHVLGISAGRAYGSIPAFTTAYCESIN